MAGTIEVKGKGENAQLAKHIQYLSTCLLYTSLIIIQVANLLICHTVHSITYWHIIQHFLMIVSPSRKGRITFSDVYQRQIWETAHAVRTDRALLKLFTNLPCKP